MNRKSFFKTLAGLSAGVLIAKTIPIKEPEKELTNPINLSPHCGEIEKIYISQSDVSKYKTEWYAISHPNKRDEFAYILNKETGEKIYL